ncbi:ABC transporter substrate-binding protein [Cohnella sp. REN36]|uniref:ABC transporter substrate-binding protein n=1 Tax=Cohnella sp. REN36 TaxID=2887347 RepID=UPI001D154A9D|nr:extracellular solute-binding protein [Cohnella sp. REN36]MCC3372437.1 extracellular solute-binding protein [Cohnella sp. REN36]
MMRMRSLVLVLCLLVSMLVAGCGTSNKSEGVQSNEVGNQEPSSNEIGSKDPIKLKFGVNVTPILTKEFWQESVAKFTKEHPNVTVELVTSPSSNVDWTTHLKTLLATGDMPDVMVMMSPGDFVPSGALAELTDADVDYLSDLNSGKMGGKRYVAIYKKQLAGIFYNKKIFADNGLSEPKTLQELIDISENLKSKGITPMSIGAKDGWPTFVLASSLVTSMVSAKNPNFGADRNAGKFTYSDPEIVKAMENFKLFSIQYAGNDVGSTSYTQILEKFFKGKTAMMPMGSWAQGEVERLKPDFEVGFFPVPNETDANVIPVFTNEGLAISSRTKYPDESMALIRSFFTDKEWYGKFLKTEMLFPTTKEDVPYEMSALRKEIGEKINNWKQVEIFTDATGDNALLPGIQGAWYKADASISMGTNVKNELAALDKEWDRANAALEK